jgi:hypothetical protein
LLLLQLASPPGRSLPATRTSLPGALPTRLRSLRHGSR